MKDAEQVMIISKTPFRLLWGAVFAALPLSLSTPKTTNAELIWSYVGDPGNMPDTNGHGSVPYPFLMSTFEVTNDDYVEFLNAVAADGDPNGLYNFGMDWLADFSGGIRRSTSGDRFTYQIQLNRGQRPVVNVEFYSAMRYANWLHNGRPTGPQGPTTTEDGAYTLGSEAIPDALVVRNPDARFFIPNEDEWYKAAYYKSGGLDAGYWQYPTQSNEAPAGRLPPGDSNSANYNLAHTNVTIVGSYPLAVGPYGTYDQAGNAAEMLETIRLSGPFIDRVVRGGSWIIDISDSTNAAVSFSIGPSGSLSTHGFRVAAIVPEPSTCAYLLGVLALGPALRWLRAQF
ncbi:MAG: SUMF1/EgtB/PvdO family nonheme iron enzyme [Planctomycetales bacterium]|nr:SUMF1/EgtB/PvdO family nonheme iron enzyme [Planctomycetales bacterium]